MPAASLIVSTYNSPRWLEKVLWSLEVQTFRDFEVVVADDGSGAATRSLLEEFRTQAPFPLRWVWHEDRGFRKTEILNQAIEAAEADYLIFTDGDCLLREDFLATHIRRRRPGYFLSGGYYKLGAELSATISRQDILDQRCFRLPWLRQHGQPRSLKDLKLTGSRVLANALNALTPTRPSWNGHNASTWKQDVLAVNGFDTRMKYGGEDREFGERLRHAGMRPLQIRYSAICVHLDHARGYVIPEMIANNRAIWDATLRERKSRTPYGIVDEFDTRD